MSRFFKNLGYGIAGILIGCMLVAALAEVAPGAVPPSVLLTMANTWRAVQSYSISGTTIANAITGTIIETIGSNMTGAVRALNVNPHVSSTSTGNLTAAGGGLIGATFNPIVDSGATGTITGAFGTTIAVNNNSAGETITTAGGIRIANATATGPITNLNGIIILSQTTGVNNTDIAVGCPGTTAGNYGILQCDSRTNTFFGPMQFSGTIPTVTGTGTPTISANSTNTSGEVTGGTLATSVVVTFSNGPLSAIPICVVTPQTQVAAFAYTVTSSAITITLTATTGESIDYHCFLR